MKKLISLALASVMAFGVLAATGCDGGEKNYNADNFLTAEQAKEEYGNEYRIVKDKVTLKIFVPRGSMNPAYSTMKMFKKLSELTNLDFEFTEADTSSYTTLRNAAWTGGDLPDFFLFSNTIAEQVSYSKNKALIPLNDPSLEVNGVQVGSLIDNYMPTYKNLLENNFNIDTDIQAKDTATLDDGKMYATVSANDVPRDLTYKMWINDQWISHINEKLSIKLKAALGVDSLPTADEIDTIEELILVLRAFKALDANANGDPNDEVPATAASMQYLRNFILAAYGAVTDGLEISNDGDTFTYTPATEAYRQYLKTAKMMFEEGLIDNSTFSNKDISQVVGKGYDNCLGMFCQAAAYLTVGYELEANYEAFGPLTSEYYTGTPLHYGFSPFGADGVMIPRGTPYVREIARLVDIMYSDIGTQLIAYGEEGVDFTWDDEEKTSWTFHVPDDWDGTQEEYRATITPNVGTGAMLYWSYNFVGKMNDDIIRRLNQESERYVPYIKVPVPEDVILDANDYAPLARIHASIDPYIAMVEYNFIVGEKGWDVNSDTDWNNYLETLKAYEYEDMLEMYNKALAKRK